MSYVDDEIDYGKDRDQWIRRGLSTRVANCLANDRILTVEHLRKVPDQHLLLMPNFGRRSLEEVHEFLRQATTPETVQSGERAWCAYLNTLTQREVHALEHAFKAGWRARDAQ